MKTPKEKRSAISIVGFSRNYENDEVVVQLVQQNSFLREFSVVNNIHDHISVFAVKPLRNKPDVFQAFARISAVLRQGFKTFKDKVMIGLASCKIYDQFHVKRCNNCQSFGHYYKNCLTPNNPVCAICTQSHKTPDCQSPLEKCISCINAGLPLAESDHRADDQNCPTLKAAQQKMKSNLNLNNQ